MPDSIPEQPEKGSDFGPQLARRMWWSRFRALVFGGLALQPLYGQYLPSTL
jgi:hypothetical protein